MSHYDVTLNCSVVGYAKIEEEGLFLRCYCKCCLPKGEIYRINLSSGKEKIDLGICVPEDEHFILEKRIKRKLISEAELQFEVIITGAEKDSVIPVDSNTPFEFISKLTHASFCIVNGNYGIKIMP